MKQLKSSVADPRELADHVRVPISSSFGDKNVLITGGTKGIGKAIAAGFAQAGANVLLNYLRDREAAEAAVEELSAFGTRIEAVRANVREADDIGRLTQSAQSRFAPVDVFVNNAALSVFKPALEMRAKDWEWTLDIGAHAFLRLTQALFPFLKKPGASLIAISSLGAVRAIPLYAAMGAAKGALEALARHLAAELGPGGVSVNVVSPGLVRTESLRHLSPDAAMVEAAERRTPAGRLVLPSEVADLVLFLASPRARMITGQTIHVDGGYSIVA